MSLFKREWGSPITKAEFNVRPQERRARTSWLAPPNAPAPAPHDDAAALRPPAVPEIDPAPIVRARSERPAEARADEPAPTPSHPPTIHAAFIVNHGQARVTELIERLTVAVELLAGERARVASKAEGQLVELACAIARRVVGHELSVDPTLLADLASEGIDALGSKEHVVVRLGDLDDDAAFQAIRQRLAGRAPQCEVVRDPTLARGACIVETEYGMVDESVEARLASVIEAVAAARREAAKS